VLSGDPLANPERLIKRVYAYAAYRVGDGPDAEEITSETFLRALRYRHTYRANRGKPITWLLAIARGLCNEHARSTWPEPTAPETLAEVSGAAHDDLEASTIRHLNLAAALGRLEPRDRELIALRYGADLRTAQIAALLEMRTNAVDVALHRALERLRARLCEP
jgi:RNA polymerase sigma-70 factor (ECF subfamily)